MESRNEYYMRRALYEAGKAMDNDEVPVGAIVVFENKIIAKGFNMCLRLNDPTAHAEMQVITSACDYLESRYLNDCELYVTLEPCPMCASAMFWAQLGHVIFGANDEKRGFSTINKSLIHPKTKVTSGVLKHECSKLLSDFFKKKRKLKEI